MIKLKIDLNKLIIIIMVTIGAVIIGISIYSNGFDAIRTYEAITLEVYLLIRLIYLMNGGKSIGRLAIITAIIHLVYFNKDLLGPYNIIQPYEAKYGFNKNYYEHIWIIYCYPFIVFELLYTLFFGNIDKIRTRNRKRENSRRFK